MGLFSFFKPKTKAITTKLVSTKKEQKNLADLQQSGKPLKVFLDLSDSGNLLMRVGVNSNLTVGKLPAKAVTQLEQTYGKKNSLACKIEIGTNYKVVSEGDTLACYVDLTIIPE